LREQSDFNGCVGVTPGAVRKARSIWQFVGTTPENCFESGAKPRMVNLRLEMCGTEADPGGSGVSGRSPYFSVMEVNLD
jgi:hypothetical protein